MQLTLDLIESTGCKIRKPLAAKSRDRLVQRFDIDRVGQLKTFYEHCNGGRVKRLGCRFYPLAEAVGLWGAFDFTMDLRFLPFFVSENNESDPCVVGIDGPLRGLVFQMCHDSDSRILAANVTSFLRSLRKQEDDEYFAIEDHVFVYPKSLSQREAKKFTALMERSRNNLDHESEAERITELALSMVGDKQLLALLAPTAHPDGNSQLQIKRRLERIGTKQSAKRLAQIQKTADVFVERCIQVLHAAGIHAQADAVYGMRVGPDSRAVNVSAFRSESKRPDFDEYLVQRIRYLFFDD